MQDMSNTGTLNTKDTVMFNTTPPRVRARDRRQLNTRLNSLGMAHG